MILVRRPRGHSALVPHGHESNWLSRIQVGCVNPEHLRKQGHPCPIRQIRGSSGQVIGSRCDHPQYLCPDTTESGNDVIVVYRQMKPESMSLTLQDFERWVSKDWNCECCSSIEDLLYVSSDVRSACLHRFAYLPTQVTVQSSRPRYAGKLCLDCSKTDASNAAFHHLDSPKHR